MQQQGNSPKSEDLLKGNPIEDRSIPVFILVISLQREKKTYLGYLICLRERLKNFRF